MPKTKLTAQGIKALPIPESGRVDYQDDTLPGLVLRVTSSGRKTFSVSYWQRGKRPRVTLGITEDSPRPGPGADIKTLSLAAARDAGKAVLQDVRIGLDPAAEKREQQAAATFEQIACDYIERHAKKKKSAKGAREDELRVERVLIPRWGHWKAGEVRRRDVVALLDEYEDEGKPYARNRMSALISKIYNHAIGRDAAGLDGNPAYGLVDASLEKPRKRVLSDAELKVLLPLFDGEGMAGLGFRLLLLTGQRPSEVFGMMWSEIDGDLWSIPKERTKNRRSKHAPDFHLVLLSPQAREILLGLRRVDRNSFVFPSPTKKETAFTSYSAVAQRVRDAAGFDDVWRVYDLKTTALTGMQKMGIEPHVLSAIANHVTGSITMKHYALGGYEAEKREALQSWGQHVAAIDPATAGKVVALGRRVQP